MSRGKYCRSRLVFSFAPRCQGLCGFFRGGMASLHQRIQRGGVFGVLYSRSGEERKRGSLVALRQRLEPFPRAILFGNDRFEYSNTMNPASIMLVGLLLWLVVGCVVAVVIGPTLKKRTPAIAVGRRSAKISAKPVPTFSSSASSRRYLN